MHRYIVRVRNYVTKSTLTSLYYAFIQSNVDYYLLNLGSLNKAGSFASKLTKRKMVKVEKKLSE